MIELKHKRGLVAIREEDILSVSLHMYGGDRGDDPIFSVTVITREASSYLEYTKLKKATRVYEYLKEYV
jgi:hypothetical protein